MHRRSNSREVGSCGWAAAIERSSAAEQLEGHIVAAVVHQANLVATTDTHGPEADVLDQLLAHGLYFTAAGHVATG